MSTPVGRRSRRQKEPEPWAEGCPPWRLVRRKVSGLKIPPDTLRAEAGEVDELAASIGEHGLLVPVLIDADGTVRAGVRRLAALRALGQREVECLIIPTRADPALVQIVENLQRKDLSPVEEARAFRKLLDRTGWTQTRLARELGVSKPRVSLALNLLSAPPDVIDRVERGKESAYAVKCAFSRAGRRDGRARAVERKLRSGETVPARFCVSAVKVPGHRLPPGLRARVFAERVEVAFSVEEASRPLGRLASLTDALRACLAGAEADVIAALRETRAKVLRMEGEYEEDA